MERYFQPPSQTTKQMSARCVGLDGLGGLAERRVQDRAGRDADEHALEVEQLAHPAHRVARTDREPGVDQRGVVELGHEALVEVAQPVDQLAVARLGGDDPHLRLVLAEEAADTHQRAGGAEPGDHVGDVGQVGEDLRAGAGVVRVGVGRVAVLVEHHPVGVLGGHAALATRTASLEPPAAGRGHDLGAPHPQQLAALLRGVLGHHADQPVALEPGGHRQRDAGVAAGGLEDRAAGPQQCRPSPPARSSPARRGP